MTDFLSYFHYNNELYLQISEGQFSNARFYTNLAEVKYNPNTDVWFGPALRHNTGWQKEDIRGTKALWVDVDDVSGNFPNGTLPPSLVVKSGGGWHVYYLLSKACEDVTAIEAMNKLLAKDIPHGDGSCWNINRILRVPGTLNCKPEYGDARRVTLELEQPEVAYDIEDFNILADLPDNIRHKIRTGDSRGHRSRSERDWKIITTLITAGASDELIVRIFNYATCGEKAREEPEYFIHTLQRARAEYVPTTTESKAKDTGPEILEGVDGLYYKGRTTTRISTFTLDPVLLLDGSMFESEDAIVCNVRAEGHEWKDVAFPKSAFNSVTKMDQHTKILAWQWLSNELTLRSVLPFLMQKLQAQGLPRVVATTVLGLHKVHGKWVYLGDSGVMSENEVWAGYSGPLAWLPSQKEHAKLDLEIKPGQAKEYKDLMSMVPSLNDPEVIWPMIGWYTMANLKPAIEESAFRFPVLNVAGTRGSGKTTLILRVFMKLFGQIDPKSYDAGTTKFVTLSLLGSSNAVPVAFSEFRIESVSAFTRYILLAYDTGHDPRGRPDQTTVDYPLTAPFSIDGEDVIDDPAGQERTVVVVLHPSTINQHTAAYEAMNNFRDKATIMPGPWIIRNLLAKIPHLREDLGASFRETMVAFPATIPDRIRRNYSVVWTGVKYWCEFAGLSRPDISVLKPSIQNIFDTDTGRSRVVADSMIEDIANAAVGGSQAFQYKVVSKSQLWFQLASAHNYWLASRRRGGRGALERDAIKNQIKEAPYFLGTQAVEGVWMYGVSLTKAFELGLDLPSEIQIGRVVFNLGKEQG